MDDELTSTPVGLGREVSFIAKRETKRVARRRPLTEKQRLVAKLHVQGLSAAEIADRMPLNRNGRKMPRQNVWAMLQTEPLQEYIAALSRSMEEKLGELEHEALPVARDLLYDPDPDIRYKTYTDLLNRMGKRGKPAERVMTQGVTLQGDLNAYIAGVLADPGVEHLLASQPELKAKLLANPERNIPGLPDPA